jgi:hypothetical protein
MRVYYDRDADLNLIKIGADVLDRMRGELGAMTKGPQVRVDRGKYRCSGTSGYGSMSHTSAKSRRALGHLCELDSIAFDSTKVA